MEFVYSRAVCRSHQREALDQTADLITQLVVTVLPRPSNSDVLCPRSGGGGLGQRGKPKSIWLSRLLFQDGRFSKLQPFVFGGEVVKSFKQMGSTSNDYKHHVRTVSNRMNHLSSSSPTST